MTPKLRFKGTQGKEYAEWEVSTLGEISEIVMGQSPSSNSYNELGQGLPLAQGKADFEGLCFSSSRFTSEPTKIIPADTILMSVRAPVGFIGYADKVVCIGRGMCAIISDYRGFLWAFLSYYESKWRKIQQGSTFEAVSGNDIRNVRLSLPTVKEEEIKITKLFKLVNDKINLLAKKKEALETYKKGLMQKIFSQELRFKREDGTDYPEWTRYILEELVEVQRGASPRPIQAYISTEGVNWIKIGDVKEGAKYITSTAQKITIEGSLKSRRVEPEDFILSNSMSFGRPYISKIHGYIHDGWLLLRNNNPEKLLNDFLYEILSSDSVKKQFVQLAAGSTVNNLKSDTVKKVSLHLPSIVEQSKIFETLNSISISIDLLQSRINKTEQLKKGLLQQMFA